MVCTINPSSYAWLVFPPAYCSRSQLESEFQAREAADQDLCRRCVEGHFLFSDDLSLETQTQELLVVILQPRWG